MDNYIEWYIDTYGTLVRIISNHQFVTLCLTYVQYFIPLLVGIWMCSFCYSVTFVWLEGQVEVNTNNIRRIKSRFSLLVRPTAFQAGTCGSELLTLIWKSSWAVRWRNTSSGNPLTPAKQFNDVCAVSNSKRACMETTTQALSLWEQTCAPQCNVYRLDDWLTYIQRMTCIAFWH